MAPRAVYVASADEDLWSDPRGEFLSLVHASPVFALWGDRPLAAGDMPPLESPARRRAARVSRAQRRPQPHPLRLAVLHGLLGHPLEVAPAAALAHPRANVQAARLPADISNDHDARERRAAGPRFGRTDHAHDRGLCACSAAALLLVGLGFRLAAGVGLTWWLPFVIAGAGVTADLLSGFVHWAADTWGRETLPVVGGGFSVPSASITSTPTTFCAVTSSTATAMSRCSCCRCSRLPCRSRSGPHWGTLPPSSCGRSPRGCSRPIRCTSGRTCRTRQRLVAWLQRHGVILSREAHHEHHVSPYVVNYCIATGWCNRWLTARQVFPRLERTIARVTGMLPRADEDAFAAHLRANPGDSRRSSRLPCLPCA